MDNQTLVTEIRKTLTEFIQNVYKINVAMLIKDIEVDTYTFILGSHLLNLFTPYDATKIIAEYFHKNLSKEAFKIISRINIVSTKDPSIVPITRAFNTKNSICIIKNCNFFNVVIDDAIILESHMD